MTQENIENGIKDVLKNASDVREAVHGITLKALSQGSLDSAAVKQVMTSVMKGVSEGASGLGTQGAKAVGEALKGLDDAVAGAAKATQLAVQEAAGRASEFSRVELQRSLDELKGLEASLLDTISRSASSAGTMVSDTARQFVEHARTQGTAVGRQVAETLPKVTESVAQLARTNIEAGVTTLRSGGAMLAGMAAGMLSGLADRLQPETRAQPPASPASDTAENGAGKPR